VSEDAPPLQPVTLDEVRAARDRLRGAALSTPLVRLGVEDGPAEVYLKLENLQPVGSFKQRGAGNAMAVAERSRLQRGVYTASAGNMAQGVAWNARRLGIQCAVVVPETAPEAKISAITRLGAEIFKEPFDVWWEVMATRRYEPLADRLFVHPFADPAVMAGNGTIGLEIVEDLPDVEAIIVPYGGGGLSCGIAATVKAIRPEALVLASEIETAAPVAASMEAGKPTEVAYSPSFVDGIGSKSLLAEMWPLVDRLLDGAIVVSLEETAAAIRLLIQRNRVVAEGAGATSVAAALTGAAGSGNVVAVISGGNIDPGKLATILQGAIP
jgi:threonine dehydratase